MCLDGIFLVFALMHGIAFAVLAHDYESLLPTLFNNGVFIACSVKFSYLNKHDLFLNPLRMNTICKGVWFLMCNFIWYRHILME